MSQKLRNTRIGRTLGFRTMAGIGIAAGMALIAGCNLDNNTGVSGPTGLVQFINAAPRYGTVGLAIDSTVVTQGQAYGSGSSYYVNALATARNFKVTGTDTTTIATGSLLVADQTVYTAIVTQHPTGAGLLFFPDTVTSPGANQIGLRIINVSPSAGTVDMYITGADTTLTTPTKANITFEQASDYVNVAPGTNRVRITAAGTKNILVDVDASGLIGGQVRSILLIDNTTSGTAPVTWLQIPDIG
jgi:hypothetical protein